MYALTALPIILLAFAPVHAQSDGLIGKPCTLMDMTGRAIDERMKGTCYYNTDGALSHWVVRASLDSPELAGYPALLKKQQDYNRWLATTSDPEPEPHCWSRQHGWEKDDRGLNSICMPNRISETGELNRDTLLIPLFMTGANILVSRGRLKDDCADASKTAGEWGRYSSRSSFDFEFLDKDVRNGWICWTNWPRAQIPKNEEFADWQEILEQRSTALVDAEKASRRYGEIVNSIPQYNNFDTQQIAPDKLPAEFFDRLSALQAAAVEGLRVDDSLKKGSANLEQRYPKMLLDAKQRWERAYEKKINSTECKEKEERIRMNLMKYLDALQLCSTREDYEACRKEAAMAFPEEKSE